MKVRLGVIFLILTAFCWSACTTAKPFATEPEGAPTVSDLPDSKEEKIAQFNKSVFCLSVIIPGPQPKRRAIGTGFLVSPKLLATAFHVKDDLEKQQAVMGRIKGQIVAWKKFDDGELIELPIVLAVADQESDMAVFAFDEERLKTQAKQRKIEPLKLAGHLPNIGEDILSIGYYGLMEFPFNSLGNVSNIENGEDIYADMTLMPGNSGSPLISMKTGEVLGVNVKVMTMGDGTLRLGIARKISKLNELIKKVKP